MLGRKTALNRPYTDFMSGGYAIHSHYLAHFRVFLQFAIHLKDGKQKENVTIIHKMLLHEVMHNIA